MLILYYVSFVVVVVVVAAVAVAVVFVKFSSGAVDARYDCFGDRRLCDPSMYTPQDDDKYSTITEGVNLWNPQRQYAGIWGVNDERTRLVEQRNLSNINKVNNYASTPFNYQAFYNRTCSTLIFFFLSIFYNNLCTKLKYCSVRTDVC